MKAPLNTKHDPREHLYIVPVLDRGGYQFLWALNPNEARRLADEKVHPEKKEVA